MRPDKSCNKTPLVSICVYNYNYGRYLEQCLYSIEKQTYPAIEVIISDNASDDNSWNIILEFCNKHPDAVTVIRNRENRGAAENLDNCLFHVRGKYFISLASDDYLSPQFIQKCVQALECYPQSAYAIVHRSIVDETGRVAQEPPFYNGSYLIPGTAQAAVYMMASVNPSVSQVLYRLSMFREINKKSCLVSRWYGARMTDFLLACEHDLVYLCDPLLFHRVHRANDAHQAQRMLLEVIGPYVIQLHFADIAYNKPELKGVVSRLPQSISKLSEISLRYCSRCILTGDDRTAIQYFYLAQALNPDIRETEFCMALTRFYSGDISRSDIHLYLNEHDTLVSRKVSYPPPEGSTKIEM